MRRVVAVVAGLALAWVASLCLGALVVGTAVLRRAMSTEPADV